MPTFLSKCYLFLVIPIEHASNLIAEIIRVCVKKLRDARRIYSPWPVAVQYVVLTSVYRWQLNVRHGAIWQTTLKLNRFRGRDERTNKWKIRSRWWHGRRKEKWQTRNYPPL